MSADVFENEAAQAFEAWEHEELTRVRSREQERVNRVRVLGYLLACAQRAADAHKDLQRHITLLLRARVDAERALDVLRTELALAEEMASLVAENDEDLNERLALALEALEDVE